MNSKLKEWYPALFILILVVLLRIGIHFLLGGNQ
ncbi:hypothetical protein IGI67_003848 [Enterococcus sp. AZ196]